MLKATLPLLVPLAAYLCAALLAAIENRRHQLRLGSNPIDLRLPRDTRGM